MSEGLALLLGLVLGAGITGCAKAPQDPAVGSYIADFTKDYQIDVSNIEIKMISNEEMTKFIPNSAGVCVSGSLIVIRSDYWITLTEGQQKFLVYHELGHCALHEAHRDAVNAVDGCPTSIMYPSVMPELCTQINPQLLIQELGDKRS